MVTSSVLARKGRVVFALAVILWFPDLTWGVTGNGWKSMSDEGREFYVMGVYDAFLSIHHLDTDVLKRESNPGLSHVVKCVQQKKMPYGQIDANVQKYMRDHPENWNYDMVGLVLGALLEACKE